MCPPEVAHQSLFCSSCPKLNTLSKLIMHDCGVCTAHKPSFHSFASVIPLYSRFFKCFLYRSFVGLCCMHSEICNFITRLYLSFDYISLFMHSYITGSGYVDMLVYQFQQNHTRNTAGLQNVLQTVAENIH
jgi:hypothetical protein